jgi:pyruvate/2-oxoglutarate dehydrogenase complex dihydrolipoamide acyltransferase (E2) component
MFGRRRRARKVAEAAAAAEPAVPADEIDTTPLADLPPWPGPVAPPAPAPAPAPEPAPEPAPLRYFAEGVAPPPEPEPEPAPAPEPDPVAVTESAPSPEDDPAFRFEPVADAPPTDAPPTDAPLATVPTATTPDRRADGSSVVPIAAGTRALAEQMRTSQQEMAQLSMHMDAWMDQAAQLRTELLVEWDEEGLRPSYTDLVIRAVARSLVRHPHLNAAIRDEGIELLADVDIGVTSSTDGDDAVHVIPGAADRSLKDITAATRAVAPSPPDAEPTFVVTSLGGYGVDSFTPVVLAPNVATLGIGRVRDEVRWEGDRPVRARVMTLVLAWDHRAFGGVTAAEFLVEVREMLEQPYRLLVD